MPGQFNLDISGHSFLTSVMAAQVGSPHPMVINCTNFGYEAYTYKATVNLGALPATGISIGWEACCRAPSDNFPFPTGDYLSIFCLIKPLPGLNYSNSSPRFYTPLNSATSFSGGAVNSVAYDPDATDSMYVQYAGPKKQNGAGITFSPGYSAQNPFGIGAANAPVDSLTGLITLDSISQGNYVFAQRIQSYRNGVHIGTYQTSAQ